MVHYDKTKKYVRRQWKRGSSYAKKRYTAKGKVNYNKIAADVMKLKSIINSEVKHFENKFVGQQVAQFNGGNSGHIFQEITPTPDQGTAYDERSGDSIKMRSVQMTFQIQKGQAITGSVAYKIVFFMMPRSPRFITGDPTIANILNKNAFNNVSYDNFSERLQEQYGDFKVIGTIRGKFLQSTFATQPGNVSQIQMRKFNKMLNYHQTFSHGQNVPNRNQIYMIMTTDNYNKANNAENVTISTHCRWNYYDN